MYSVVTRNYVLFGTVVYCLCLLQIASCTAVLMSRYLSGEMENNSTPCTMIQNSTIFGILAVELFVSGLKLLPALDS